MSLFNSNGDQVGAMSLRLSKSTDTTRTRTSTTSESSFLTSGNSDEFILGIETRFTIGFCIHTPELRADRPHCGARAGPQGRRNHSTNYDGQKCRKPGLPGVAATQERYLGCLHRDECVEARRAQSHQRGYRDYTAPLSRH